MTRKTSSRPFNASALKDSDLLPKICFARKQVELAAPSLTEAIHARQELKGACEILARRTGTEYTPVNMTQAINQDKERHPAPTAKEMEYAVHYADKKACETFGMLDALLTVNDDNRRFVLARMENKHRLKVCQEAEARLADIVVLKLRSLREKKAKLKGNQP